jgi:hypothetical protein
VSLARPGDDVKRRRTPRSGVPILDSIPQDRSAVSKFLDPNCDVTELEAAIPTSDQPAGLALGADRVSARRPGDYRCLAGSLRPEHVRRVARSAAGCWAMSAGRGARIADDHYRALVDTA